MRRGGLALTAALLVCVPSGADAQPLSGGAKAGAAISPFSDDRETATHAGFAGGAFLLIPLSASWAVQPEILFTASAIGVRLPGARLDVAEVPYLDLPVLLRFGRLHGSGARWYGLAGAGIGIRIETTLAGEAFTQEQAASIKDAVHAILPHVVLGGGLRLGDALVEARWTQGLGDAADASTLIADRRRRTFSVLAGFYVR